MKAIREMPDELFHRAKATAAQRGQRKQLITAALQHELSEPKHATGSARIRRVEVRAMMRELKKMSKPISAIWPDGVSAVDAIREQRREL